MNLLLDIVNPIVGYAKWILLLFVLFLSREKIVEVVLKIREILKKWRKKNEEKKEQFGK